eukprot:5316300-Pleurochrysis_carterae.AAC.1
MKVWYVCCGSGCGGNTRRARLAMAWMRQWGQGSVCVCVWAGSGGRHREHGCGKAEEVGGTGERGTGKK